MVNVPKDATLLAAIWSKCAKLPPLMSIVPELDIVSAPVPESVNVRAEPVPKLNVVEAAMVHVPLTVVALPPNVLILLPPPLIPRLA